jgi:ribonuclease HI
MPAGRPSQQVSKFREVRMTTKGALNADKVVAAARERASLVAAPFSQRAPLPQHGRQQGLYYAGIFDGTAILRTTELGPLPPPAWWRRVVEAWTDGSLYFANEDEHCQSKNLRMGAGVYFPSLLLRLSAAVPPGVSSSTRAEVFAIVVAAASAPVRCRLRIYSDSTAAIALCEAALRPNLTVAAQQRLACFDLLELLRIAVHRNQLEQVTFAWVKGHAGDAHNETADRLAAIGASRRPIAFPLINAILASPVLKHLPRHGPPRSLAPMAFATNPRRLILSAHQVLLSRELSLRDLLGGALDSTIHWRVCARVLHGGSAVLARISSPAASENTIHRLKLRANQSSNRAQRAALRHPPPPPTQEEGDNAIPGLDDEAGPLNPAPDLGCTCGQRDDVLHWLVCNANHLLREAAAVRARANIAARLERGLQCSRRASVSVANQVLAIVFGDEFVCGMAAMGLATEETVESLKQAYVRGTGKSADGAQWERTAAAMVDVCASALNDCVREPHVRRLDQERPAIDGKFEIVASDKGYVPEPGAGSRRCAICGSRGDQHVPSVCDAVDASLLLLADRLRGGQGKLPGWRC